MIEYALEQCFSKLTAALYEYQSKRKNLQKPLTTEKKKEKKSNSMILRYSDFQQLDPSGKQ
jgi:hypothetical protein